MGALNTLGERIRHFRELKRWTQPQLAKASGIKQDRISKIENGRNNAYFWEVERLALYLEVPLAWLDTVRHRLERGKRPPPPPDEKPAPPPERRSGRAKWDTGTGAGAV